jgi:hypothetical protein
MADIEFFLDRSLGRRLVPQALRAAGWTLRTHHEVYRERDEDVSDVEWLGMCGRERLPVLTKDRRLRYRPAEIEAIRRFGVRAFILTGGSLRAPEQAARFEKGRARIEEACSARGPFIYAVQADRIVRIFPRA